jgi:hypothetical protein
MAARPSAQCAIARGCLGHTDGASLYRYAVLLPPTPRPPGTPFTRDSPERSAGDPRSGFMIKDTTDPCGFAYISNQAGLIYNAEPIR